MKVNAETFREFLDRSNAGELRNYLIEAFVNNYLSPRSMAMTSFLAGQGIQVKSTAGELEELLVAFDTFYIVRNPRGHQRMIAVPTGYERSELVKSMIEPNERITNIFRNKPDMKCTYVAPRKPYSIESHTTNHDDDKSAIADRPSVSDRPSSVQTVVERPFAGVSLSKEPTLTSSMAVAMLAQVSQLSYAYEPYHYEPYASKAVAQPVIHKSEPSATESNELAHKYYGDGASLYGPDFSEFS